MSDVPVHISVVIPCWNAESTLDACLSALAAQTLAPGTFEVLLVDNNSTDRSIEIAKRHPHVTLLHEAKQGAYAARNRALGEIEGSVVAFTDPDCVPEPDWLERLTAPFADESVQIVLGRPVPVGRSATLEVIAEYEREKEAFVFASDDPSLYYGHTNDMAARRSAFDALGLFEERARGGDTIFVRRVVDRHGCASVRYCPEARVEHREIDGASSWLAKARIYGRSARSYGQVTPSRPLSRRERWHIARATNREKPLSRRLLLYGLLALESVAWRWGQWRGRLGGPA